MDNTLIGWTRTTVNAMWVGLLVWLNSRFNWGINFEDPTIIVIVGLTAGVVWRLSEVAAKVPILGYILFGINKSPGYEQPTPPNPVVEADAPVDAGEITIRDVVYVLAVIALVLGVIVLGRMVF